MQKQMSNLGRRLRLYPIWIPAVFGGSSNLHSIAYAIPFVKHLFRHYSEIFAVFKRIPGPIVVANVTLRRY